MKANCYKCKYRGALVGNTHSCCKHPSIKDERTSLEKAIGIRASVGRVPSAGPAPNDKLNIRGNKQGIARGWFAWPHNFDPVWLENCDGFIPKEASDDEA